ncbi:MAG: N-acetyl-alpha-D-glucosaminyl L-malate synthase BshA [Bacteroidetes bacterium]|nr:N-acetyl-alpha-D-glucosaminyl L-malate synthase BshA [Bacteroidota bacterium]
MKIAIVCYPTFGGSGVVATELGMALVRLGHEIHFITYSQPVRLALLEKNIYYHEVDVPEYPLFKHQPYDLALSSKLVDTIKAYQIELLHVHYAIPHAYAGYMAKKMLKEEGIFIPMITTLHGTDITLVGSHPFYRTAVTFSINKSDRVTAVSKNLRDTTYAMFDIQKEIEVIPNFIDIQRYIEKAKEPCDRTLMALQSEIIFTHVSNFRAVKRVEDIVEIFARVNEHHPSVLIMVGEGPERIKAERLAKQKGVYDKVKFLGNSVEIDKVLCMSDIFLLPSSEESFGLAALEAMANKTAVISSNAGGLPEVNIHEHTGYVCEVGDVEQMSAYALKLAQDSDLLHTMKTNALESARRFDLPEIVPIYERLYESAYASRHQNQD